MKKIVMLTCYDYSFAKILDGIGIDYILVGDSLAMVVLGHKDTKQVTMEQMIHHTKAVCNGAKNSFVIGDMPINSYETEDDAIKNARRFLEAGAKAVKIEGCRPEIINALQKEKINVMGHIGLTPQTIEANKVQGKDAESAGRIYQEAISLDKLNLIALVLEGIPSPLAKKITESIKTPTIGIGAGKHCSGQVLVLHDMLGLFSDFKPKFVKQYAALNKDIKKAITSFKEEVEAGKYPAEEYSYQ